MKTRGRSKLSLGGRVYFFKPTTSLDGIRIQKGHLAVKLLLQIEILCRNVVIRMKVMVPNCGPPKQLGPIKQ